MQRSVALLAALCFTALTFICFSNKKYAHKEFSSLSMYEYESELREVQKNKLKIDTVSIEQFIKDYDIAFKIIKKATKKGEVNELVLQSGPETKFLKYHFRSVDTVTSEIFGNSNRYILNNNKDAVVYKVKSNDSDKLYFTFVTYIFNEENNPIDVYDVVEYYHYFVLTVKK